MPRSIDRRERAERNHLTDIGIGVPVVGGRRSCLAIQTGLGYGVLLRASSAGLGRCGRFVGKVLPAR